MTAREILPNPAKARLAAGKPIFGPIITFADPVANEVLLAHPWDFVWIEQEHTALGSESVSRAIQLAIGKGIAPLVRVPWNEQWLVKPILDVGAMGVVLPLVRNKKEAEKAVRSTKYPPAGDRGFFPLVAAKRWGLPVPEYAARANDEILSIVQIEHVDAVDNLDPILEVEGIDVLFLGPYDLSGSVNRLGEIEHPDVKKAIRKFLKKTDGQVARGIYAKTLEEVERRLNEGFLFIMVAADFSFLEEAVADYVWGLSEIRERLGVG